MKEDSDTMPGPIHRNRSATRLSEGSLQALAA
jgi:hypothetical protein